MIWIKPSQVGKHCEQGKRILAAGYTDRNRIAFVYHMILIHRTADIRQHFLHDEPPDQLCQF